ncbi:MAG: hypothetical protein KJ000_33125 [Pirellulaceae bacterium]|nr:hypothetical protein [Pirellulaceae bacterium]
MQRLWWGQKKTGAKLANVRKVFNRNNGVLWLTEQLEERAQLERWPILRL